MYERTLIRVNDALKTAESVGNDSKEQTEVGISVIIESFIH